MSGPTSVLAAFASGLRFEQLPPAVVLHAKNALLNFLACAVAGVNEEVVTRSSKAFGPYAGPGEATIIGRTDTTDPVNASFLNGMSSSILAFDETHARALVHPVGPVAAAALALGEARRVSGRDLLCALVAGVEVGCRTSLAVSVPPAKGLVGWSQTGICAGIGAAAGVARLMGLDCTTAADAIGLGANASAGLRAMNGTMAVAVAASNAAANGYRAALLAEAGIRTDASALEHPYGFVSLYAQEGHLPALTEELGTHYAISDTHFKPYPCAIVAHAAIDAAAEIRGRFQLTGNEVEEVLVAVHPSGIALGDRPKVSNANEASVSIQYWVASALLNDRVGPECLSGAWLADAQREELQQSVRLLPDDALPRSAAHLTVRVKDGRALDFLAEHALGSAARPMTSDDLDCKFAAATAPTFSPARIREVIDACRAIERMDDVRTLMRLLRA